MNLCPVCRKSFELFTSEFHLIDENRVVSFCSKTCCEKYRKSSHIAIYAQFVLNRNLISLIIALISVGLIVSGVYQLGKMESAKQISFDGFVKTSWSYGLLKVEDEQNSAISSEPVFDPVIISEKAKLIVEDAVKNKNLDYWGIIAAEVLVKLGDKKATEKLMEIAEKAIPSHRMRISEILARAGDLKSLEFLRRHMNDRKSPLWIVSAFACGRLGDKTSIKPLRYLMMLEETRFAAAESLAFTGDINSREWIYRRAIKSSRPGDRVKAARALAAIGDKRAIPILKDSLEKTSFKFMSAVGLGLAGDKSVIPVLEKALEHPGLRIEAATVLTSLNHVQSYKLLANELGSQVFINKISAAISIYIMLNAQKNAPVALEAGSNVKRGRING